MRTVMLILSVFNLIYLVTTIAAGEAVNIYLSPVGLPYYIAISLAILSVVILLITQTGEGRAKKLSLSAILVNVAGIFLVSILFI
ncbi:hypothetical protein SAMN05216187_101234 [Jeotgalicoccus aerolatus]|uniref:Uncharacterized protein n=1 Tax=Jeotgalicoccus aerolatus TaxID=709510 RepID=A0A1G8V6Q7_9STAP|nr:hypothetical protein [Jeotgalicoccus aerolatus]SDJ61748.1 hypothetical protein SAMN05216187_101234 [Jeotgalicoccus aerolatus]